MDVDIAGKSRLYGTGRRYTTIIERWTSHIDYEWAADQAFGWAPCIHFSSSSRVSET